MKKILLLTGALIALLTISACASNVSLTQDDLELLCEDQDATLARGDIMAEELAEVCAGYGSDVQAAPGLDPGSSLKKATLLRAKSISTTLDAKCIEPCGAPKKGCCKWDDEGPKTPNDVSLQP